METIPKTYAERVAANLRHMATPRSEWSALAPLGFEQDDEGRAMPEFDFGQVAGYTSAPTLYKPEGQPCCELCGRQGIKYVYHLRNDAKRWLLAVGSECVTHFEEKSGEELAKESQDARQRTLFIALHEAKRGLARDFRRIISNGYGSSWEKWDFADACRMYQDATKLVGKVAPDSSPAAITRWHKTKGEAAKELLTRIADFHARDYIKEHRTRPLQAQIERYRREIETGWTYDRSTQITEEAKANRVQLIQEVRNQIRAIYSQPAISERINAA